MPSRAMKAKRERRTHAVLFTVLLIFAAFFGLCAAGAYGFYNLCNEWLSDLPDYTNIEQYTESTATKIYASDGTTLLAKLYLENRQPVSYDQVTPYLYEATVATEDVRFYEHDGVDVQGIARAIVVDISNGNTSEGASTITQQLVRNTILLDEMNDISIRRKIREAYLAKQVEKQYSKQQILEMYCNIINYGGGCYGIQAASRYYFSKDASELDLSEAALLAGIPQSPTNLNPFNNYNASIARRNVVLQRMLSNGYITQDEYDAAVSEQIVLNKEVQANNGVYQEPYWVDYVKGLLYEKYSTAEIFKGGLTVYTTLSMGLQAAAEQACADGIAGEADDMEASLACVDAKTGYILALVGGKDYNLDQYNLATQAKRQCGSSFKAFTLAAAIEQGISPDSTWNGSSPLQITASWTVENESGEAYRSISLADATVHSLNTVFAQIVVQIGPDKVVDVARRCGITSDLEAVNSITLGTQGVCPLEMADAFACFGNGGVHHDTVAIISILDNDGNIIYSDPQTSSQALTPEVAYAVTKVLSEDITQGTATRAQLNSTQVCAGKTGTTQNYRDAYFVGYTPQLSTAVWVGTRAERNNITFNGTNLYGGYACCPIWKEFMDVALQYYTPEGWITAADPVYTVTGAQSEGSQAASSATSTPTSVVATTVTTYEYSDTVPAGSVISQTTDPTTGVTTIVISNGPTEPTEPTEPTDPGTSGTSSSASASTPSS